MNDNSNNNIVDEGILDKIDAVVDKIGQAGRFKKRLSRFLKKAVNSRKFNKQFNGVFCDDDAFDFNKCKKEGVKVEFPDFDKDVSVKHIKKLRNCSALVEFSITLTDEKAFSLLIGRKYEDLTDSDKLSTLKYDGLINITLESKNGKKNLYNELSEIDQSFSLPNDAVEKETSIQQFIDKKLNNLTLVFRIKITNFTPRSLNDSEKHGWNIIGNLDKSIFDTLESMDGSVYLELDFNVGKDEQKLIKVGSYNIGKIEFELDAENFVKNNFGFVANAVAQVFDKPSSITFSPSFNRKSEIGDAEDFGSSSSGNYDSRLDKINAALNKAKDKIENETVRDSIVFDASYRKSSSTYSITIQCRNSSNDVIDLAYITFKEN